jgi:hypothetical protein
VLALLQPEAWLRAPGPANHGFAEKRREHGSRTPKMRLSLPDEDCNNHLRLLPRIRLQINLHRQQETHDHVVEARVKCQFNNLLLIKKFA